MCNSSFLDNTHYGGISGSAVNNTPNSNSFVHNVHNTTFGSISMIGTGIVPPKLGPTVPKLGGFGTRTNSISIKPNDPNNVCTLSDKYSRRFLCHFPIFVF